MTGSQLRCSPEFLAQPATNFWASTRKSARRNTIWLLQSSSWPLEESKAWGIRTLQGAVRPLCQFCLPELLLATNAFQGPHQWVRGILGRKGLLFLFVFKNHRGARQFSSDPHRKPECAAFHEHGHRSLLNSLLRTPPDIRSVREKGGRLGLCLPARVKKTSERKVDARRFEDCELSIALQMIHSRPLILQVMRRGEQRAYSPGAPWMSP